MKKITLLWMAGLAILAISSCNTPTQGTKSPDSASCDSMCSDSSNSESDTIVRMTLDSAQGK
jgi:hypothetical protein